MRSLARTRRTAVVSALAFATVASPALTSASQAAVPKPGLVGSRVVLQNDADFSGYDAATDNAGNTYIGWIGDSDTGNANRRVYLCTLPPGSGGCRGGVQSIAALDSSGSTGLRVLATAGGAVTLVWYHEVATPAYDGRDGRIATATSLKGGPLTAATDVATGPSYGELLDARFGPGGWLWTIAAVGAGTDTMEVREGVQHPPVTVALPYSPGSATLGFSGSKPVIALQMDASITHPAGYVQGSGAGFTHLVNVPATWTAGANVDMVATKTGLRLIASVSNADYFPVISKWTGSAFATPHLTGDTGGCAPSTHDLNTDASGRLVDISNECGTLTVANLPATTVAGLIRFSSGGYPADGVPQIATTPRGHGVAVWSIEAGAGHGNRLYYSRLLLPGLDRSVAKKNGAGKVTLTGPTSCLPASSILAAVHGSPAAHWRVQSAALTFNGHKLGAKTTINGAGLRAGKLYALSGRVVFRKGGTRVALTESLKFWTCINP